MAVSPVPRSTVSVEFGRQPPNGVGPRPNVQTEGSHPPNGVRSSMLGRRRSSDPAHEFVLRAGDAEGDLGRFRSTRSSLPDEMPRWQHRVFLRRSPATVSRFLPPGWKCGCPTLAWATVGPMISRFLLSGSARCSWPSNAPSGARRVVCRGDPMVHAGDAKQMPPRCWYGLRRAALLDSVGFTRSRSVCGLMERAMRVRVAARRLAPRVNAHGRPSRVVHFIAPSWAVSTDNHPIE